MEKALYVVVPVAIVHVGNETTGSQWKVRRILLDGSVIREFLDEDYLLAVRREAEALDAQLVVGELLAACSVWVHAPELTVTDEGNLLTALNPCSIAFALGISGQSLLVLAIGIHDEEHLMALVFLNTVVTHLVNHLLAIRRSFCGPNTSHSPKSLWCHQVVLHLDVVFLNHSLCIDCCRTHGEGCSSQNHCFNHIFVILLNIFCKGTANRGQYKINRDLFL